MDERRPQGAQPVRSRFAPNRRDALRRDVARRVYWERNVTSQVVHLAGGAHPSSSDPLYGFDVSHYKTYGGLIAAAMSPPYVL